MGDEVMEWWSELRITDYELRSSEFGEATGRQGDGENGWLGDRASLRQD